MFTDELNITRTMEDSVMSPQLWAMFFNKLGFAKKYEQSV